MTKKKKNEEKIYNIPLLAVRTCDWWQAVLYQEKVFLDSSDRTMGLLPWEKDESNSIFFADRLFLIISINTAIIFTRELNKALHQCGDMSIKNIYEKLIPVETGLCYLRNMNTHSDEYIENIGDFQENFTFLFKKNKFKITLTALHTLSYNNENYLGKINIDKLVAIFRENIQDVKNITKYAFYNYSSYPLIREKKNLTLQE